MRLSIRIPALKDSFQSRHKITWCFFYYFIETERTKRDDDGAKNRWTGASIYYYLLLNGNSVEVEEDEELVEKYEGLATFIYLYINNILTNYI